MGKITMIRLPWPPTKTSANGSQGDFQGKARSAKSYKVTCAWECRAQNIKPISATGDVSVRITYYPPSHRRMDWDNISNRAKQAWDAVAEATGIDDGRWWPVSLHKGEPVKGGAIILEIMTEESK